MRTLSYQYLLYHNYPEARQRAQQYLTHHHRPSVQNICICMKDLILAEMRHTIFGQKYPSNKHSSILESNKPQEE